MPLLDLLNQSRLVVPIPYIVILMKQPHWWSLPATNSGRGWRAAENKTRPGTNRHHNTEPSREFSHTKGEQTEKYNVTPDKFHNCTGHHYSVKNIKIVTAKAQTQDRIKIQAARASRVENEKFIEIGVQIPRQAGSRN